MIDKDAEAPRAFSTATSAVSSMDDDDAGPPSSINVARALASLRSDELQRVEELVRADEEVAADEREEDESDEDEDEDVDSQVGVETAPSPPQVPTLTIGKTIALSELAQRMGVPREDLPATLVARGFYALDAKAVLPRQTARAIAELYGWKVEYAPLDEGEEEELEVPAPARSGTRSRIATKRKVAPKSKPKVKAKAKTKASAAKPAKRRLSR